MPSSKPPARGVYTLTFFDAAGDYIAVAITSDGRCVDWRPYKPATKEQAVATLLYRLDECDPVPLLRVI